MLLPLRPESFKWLGLSVGTAQTVAKVWLKAAADYDDNRFQSEVEVRQENSRIAVFVALVPPTDYGSAHGRHRLCWLSTPSAQGSPKHVRWEDN